MHSVTMDHCEMCGLLETRRALHSSSLKTLAMPRTPSEGLMVVQYVDGAPELSYQMAKEVAVVAVTVGLRHDLVAAHSTQMIDAMNAGIADTTPAIATDIDAAEGAGHVADQEAKVAAAAVRVIAAVVHAADHVPDHDLDHVVPALSHARHPHAVADHTVVVTENRDQGQGHAQGRRQEKMAPRAIRTESNEVFKKNNHKDLCVDLSNTFHYLHRSLLF